MKFYMHGCIWMVAVLLVVVLPGPTLARDLTLERVTTTDTLPSEFGLEQNYPNPFNPATTISFRLPKDTSVTFTIFSVTGQRIDGATLDTCIAAGFYHLVWVADSLPSGIYFYKLETGGFTETKKMVLLK